MCGLLVFASGASPERISPTSLLNHETSDHLLSLRVALSAAMLGILLHTQDVNQRCVPVKTCILRKNTDNSRLRAKLKSWISAPPVIVLVRGYGPHCAETCAVPLGVAVPDG